METCLKHPAHTCGYGPDDDEDENDVAAAAEAPKEGSSIVTAATSSPAATRYRSRYIPVDECPGRLGPSCCLAASRPCAAAAVAAAEWQVGASHAGVADTSRGEGAGTGRPRCEEDSGLGTESSCEKESRETEVYASPFPSRGKARGNPLVPPAAVCGYGVCEDVEEDD